MPFILSHNDVPSLALLPSLGSALLYTSERADSLSATKHSDTEAKPRLSETSRRVSSPSAVGSSFLPPTLLLSCWRAVSALAPVEAARVPEEDATFWLRGFRRIVFPMYSALI
eukprot:Platyproteum_vivax@DN11430_c0_g1_i1.p1